MTGAVEADLSFNEIEALGTKAARGAGIGWGHAEDLGRAARWLAERGTDWSLPLLQILDSDDAPSLLTAMVRACDRASSASAGETWPIGDGDPVWVVPMLAASIYGRGIGLVLRWPEKSMVLCPDGSANVSSNTFQLGDHDGPVTVEVTANTLSLAHTLRVVSRPTPIAMTVEAQLSAYAACILVPASEASRALGAGSNRSDND